MIESSEVVSRSLKKNLEDCSIGNVEILNKNWIDNSERELGRGFDLVICSHFLRQMKDLGKHLEKMEDASRRYCAVIQLAGRDDMVKEMWWEVPVR